jgi:hypothetical protein
MSIKIKDSKDVDVLKNEYLTQDDNFLSYKLSYCKKNSVIKDS